MRGLNGVGYNSYLCIEDGCSCMARRRRLAQRETDSDHVGNGSTVPRQRLLCRDLTGYYYCAMGRKSQDFFEGQESVSQITTRVSNDKATRLVNTSAATSKEPHPHQH